MSETTLLSLPLIEASQSQKHVTHNEALMLLDAAIQLSVKSRSVAAPPAAPASGDRYLVAAAASGAWAGRDGQLAVSETGAWRFAVPRAGWRLWAEDEAKFLVFDGTAWTDLQAISELQNMDLLGINTTADATNRLAVASPAVLFSHGGSDQRLKINKQAAGDTASLVFQTGFAGHAEMGLAGDDNFHVKVSADGVAWNAAIDIDRTTGAVSFPNSSIGGGSSLPYVYLSGLVTDGATDQSATIQAAINGLGTAGGTIFLPSGSVAIASTLTVSESDIAIVGFGGDERHTGGTAGGQAGTTLKWTGASGGTMVRYQSAEGASEQKRTGGGLRGVLLDANGLADYGLTVISWNGGLFRDLGFNEFLAAGLLLDVVATLGYDPRDTQNNLFSMLSFAEVTQSGKGIWLRSSNAGANPSFNVFDQLSLVTKNGDGVVLDNCDNNIFRSLRVYRAAGGSGNPLVFNGSNSDATYVARDNWIGHFSANAAAIARGTTSFIYPCGRNHITGIDRTNATPEPTIETGAHLKFAFADGTEHRTAIVRGGFANNDTQATAVFDLLQASSSLSAAIVNNSDAHLQLANAAGSAKWLASVNSATGDFRLQLQAGPGTAKLMLRDAAGWYIGQNNHLLAATDNAIDIGASGATRPRHIYAAGTVTGSNLSGTNTGDESESGMRAKLAAGSGGGTTNFLRADGNWAAPAGGGGGSGDVVGPASATDNAVARFDTATGKLIQDSGVTISDNGDVTLPALTTDPAAPAADKLVLFARKVAGRIRPAFRNPGNAVADIQVSLAHKRIASWQAAGNSTTVTAVGAAGLTATGTATSAISAATNSYTLQRKVEYLVTAASATAVAGFRNAQQLWLRGNAGTGGFHFVCRWGMATGVATSTNRAFVGLQSSVAAPTDVQPSSLLNILGMGWDAADANIQFLCNDGTGTASKIDTGIAVPTVDRTTSYELEMFCEPGGSTVNFRITELSSGTVYENSVSTDLPAATTFLSPNCYASVGGTSSVIGIALMQLHIETDY